MKCSKCGTVMVLKQEVTIITNQEGVYDGTGYESYYKCPYCKDDNADDIDYHDCFDENTNYGDR